MGTKNSAKKQTASTQVETVTCRHCRYERPAADEHCHICGYPWPWLPKEDSRLESKPKA